MISDSEYQEMTLARAPRKTECPMPHHIGNPLTHYECQLAHFRGTQVGDLCQLWCNVGAIGCTLGAPFPRIFFYNRPPAVGCRKRKCPRVPTRSYLAHFGAQFGSYLAFTIGRSSQHQSMYPRSARKSVKDTSLIRKSDTIVQQPSFLNQRSGSTSLIHTRPASCFRFFGLGVTVLLGLSLRVLEVLGSSWQGRQAQNKRKSVKKSNRKACRKLYWHLSRKL